MKTILETVQDYGLELKAEGNLLRSFCPFHTDTGRPNFTVYPDTDSWFCFACSDGGDVTSFVARIENISYAEAKKKLAEAKVDLDELQQKIDGLAVEDEPMMFNDDLNAFISRYCRDYLYKHPENETKVFDTLKLIDAILLGPVPHKKMLETISFLKQNLPTGE